MSALAALTAVLMAPDSAKGQLEFLQHVAADGAFHVNSVVIAGPTEAVLIDTQFFAEDARAVADQIAASGRKLKAIFIAHPDHDHFSGAAVIVERFPGTPVYMTEAARVHFEREGREAFRIDKERRGDVLADSVATPRVLPSNVLTVDGAVIEIIPDLQGDVLDPVNSVVWVPSERTLIASDLVFNGVHVWLGASNVETRKRWSADLRRLQELGAERVIPGHKPTIDTPDTPDALGTMIDYLALFDEALEGASDGAEVWGQVTEQYPWAVEGLLRYSAQQAVRRRSGG
jgi:glyoxylase-like metal-dependent hydrolase (beta-lactamase superfamily II)